MTEKQALTIVQHVAADSSRVEGQIPGVLEALASLTLANRIHMQQLKGELFELRGLVAEVQADSDRLSEMIGKTAVIAGEGKALAKVLEERLEYITQPE